MKATSMKVLFVLCQLLRVFALFVTNIHKNRKEIRTGENRAIKKTKLFVTLVLLENQHLLINDQEGINKRIKLSSQLINLHSLMFKMAAKTTSKETFYFVKRL